MLETRHWTPLPINNFNNYESKNNMGQAVGTALEIRHWTALWTVEHLQARCCLIS